MKRTMVIRWLVGMGWMIGGLLLASQSAANATGPPHALASVAQCHNAIENGSFETGDFEYWMTIGDPWVESLLEGVAVDVRPDILHDGRIALETVVQAGAFDPSSPCGIPTGARYLGRIDLPVYRGTLAYASGT